jgi:hypothetical protein
MDTTEILIQGATAIIAVAALGVAVYEGRSTRKHNRLSVVPRLAITHHLLGSKGRLGISVLNTGLGPAIIERCDIMVDGERVNSWEDACRALDLMEPSLGYDDITPGSISPNERRWLLSIGADSDTTQRIKVLSKALQRLHVGITYSSIYGENFHVAYSSKRTA